MAQGDKGFGEQLFNRLKDKGLSRGQVYRVLSLQRLDPEVAELGAKGLLTEAQLLEISKIASAARQKQLAQLALEKKLAASWVKELSKIVRKAEKADSDVEANRCWDYFFEIKEKIEHDGPTRPLLREIKAFRPDQPRGEKGSEDVFESDERRLIPFNSLDVELGRGLDVGTVNICAAARDAADKIYYNIQRDAFLDVRSDKYTRKMLMKLGIDYLVQGDKGYVVGDPAFELANIFEKSTRRPMKDGMISPLEPEALMIVSLLIAQLIGRPGEEREICAYSIPADPIDVDRNVVYHRGALESVLRKLGYTPKPIIEGHAVVFAELREQDYTGIGISCGGGMFNICVAYKGLPALSLSTSRGGDWIDNNVSHALGMPNSTVCSVKESGVDLLNPGDRIQDAIAIYYRNLISYTLETFCKKFETAQHMPHFSKPVDLVCAGGTSMIKGFIEVFKDEFEKVDFPIKVRRIRMASEPLLTVATGCLQAAAEEMEAMQETEIHSVPLERAEVSSMDRFDTEIRQKISAARAEPVVEVPSPAPDKSPVQDEEPSAPEKPPVQEEPPKQDPAPKQDLAPEQEFSDSEEPTSPEVKTEDPPEQAAEPAPEQDPKESSPPGQTADPVEDPAPKQDLASEPDLEEASASGQEVSGPENSPAPERVEPELEEVEPGVFRSTAPKETAPSSPGESPDPPDNGDPAIETAEFEEIEEVEEAGAPAEASKDEEDRDFPVIS